MRTPRDMIREALDHARRRDSEKGGGGWRSTREVAERSGLSLSRCRRHLDGMEDEGEVEAVDNGNTYLWRLLPAIEAQP